MNYLAKQDILANKQDLLDNLKYLRKLEYQQNNGINCGDQINGCHICLEQYTSEEISEAQKIIHNDNKRRNRLYHRTNRMFEYANKNNYTVLFLTLTFEDTYLEKTTQAKRHNTVVRFLGSFNFIDYYANIDFGKKNEREHYHALVLADNDFIIKNFIKQWYDKTHSFIKLKIISQNDNNTKMRLAKYVAKLTNHALKETAQATRIIYCNKVRYDYDKENVYIIENDNEPLPFEALQTSETISDVVSDFDCRLNFTETKNANAEIRRKAVRKQIADAKAKAKKLHKLYDYEPKDIIAIASNHYCKIPHKKLEKI